MAVNGVIVETLVSIKSHEIYMHICMYVLYLECNEYKYSYLLKGISIFIMYLLRSYDASWLMMAP